MDIRKPRTAKVQSSVVELALGNGEKLLVQTVHPADWSLAQPIFGSTDPTVMGELNRLFQVNILPGKKSIGKVVLHSIPRNVCDPFPRETDAGLLLDSGVRTNYWLTTLYQEGKLQIGASGLWFKERKYQAFYDMLTAQGMLVWSEGEGGEPRFLPVYDKLGLLRQGSRQRIVSNSHFFQMELSDCGTPWDRVGTPFGLLVHDGEILMPPLFQREALLVGRSGTVGIEHPELSKLDVAIGADLFRDGENGLFFARPEYAVTPKEPCTDIVIVGRSIIAVRPGGGTPIPSGGFVLRTRVGYQPGTLHVAYRGMESIRFGVQVGPAMVVRGKAAKEFGSPFYQGQGTAFPPTVYPLDWRNGRAARLGLGSQDGRPVLIWVEGANKHFYTPGVDSCGASLSEFAALCEDLGLDELVNLDGGGSAQICIDGGRRLRLSDRYPESGLDAERPVPVGLAFRMDH